VDALALGAAAADGAALGTRRATLSLGRHASCFAGDGAGVANGAAGWVVAFAFAEVSAGNLGLREPTGSTM
jgi:hypothetical protein